MPLTPAPADRLASRLSPRLRRWTAGVGGLLGATALLAAALPVAVPDSLRTDRALGAEQAADAIAQEDLTAFLDTTRWGRSLREIQAEREAAERVDDGGINPVLAEMGYVGLIVTPQQTAMLLALPDGTVARHYLGDLVPDGRTLSSLTDNALTLRSSDGTEEMLELFPGRKPNTDA